MVTLDTGLKENQVDENLEVPTDVITIQVSSEDESDSDYEINVEGGIPGDYMPIPSEEGDHLNESSAESTEDGSPNEPVYDLPGIEPMETTLAREVWSKPPPIECNIELSNEKVNEVKLAMSNITLPPSAIPDWAKNISEDEWKKQLAKRLQTE